MSAEVVVSLIGFLGTLIAAIRWLLEVWFKKSSALEDQKHENHQLKITSLRSEADNIKKEFEQFKKDFNGELEKLRLEMSSFRDELKRVVGKYSENQQQSVKVLSALDTFSTEVKNDREALNRRIQFVETEVKNYGMVILKERDGKP